MTVRKTVLSAIAASIITLFSVIPVEAKGDSVYNTARNYIGMHERYNRTQLKTVTKVDPARTPWCAAFVNGILKQAGLRGTGSNMAKSFAKYGIATTSPRKGDIVLIKTSSRRGRSNGHVGIFDKFVGTRVAVLGGNQSNMVKVTHFHKKNVVSYRKV